MRLVCGLVVGLGLSLAPVAAAPRDDAGRANFEAAQATCLSTEDIAAKAKIEACTTALNSGRAPPRTRGWLLQARATARTDANDHGGAIADLDAALKLAPGDPYLYRLRGIAYSQKGDYDLALKDLDEAIRLRPAEGWNYFHRGVVLGRKRDYARALLDYDMGLKLRPGQPHMLKLQGIARLRLGDPAGAMRDFDAATAAGSQDEDLEYQRGVAWYDLGDTDKALAIFTALRTRRPETALVHHMLARTLARRGELEAALASYDRTLELDSSEPAAHYNRALVLRRLNREAEALSAVNRALAVNPREPDYNELRARALIALKRTKEALRTLDRAIGYNPKGADLLRLRGITLSDGGAPAKALDDFNRARAADPGDAWNHFNLGVVLTRLNRDREAIPAYDEAIRLQPDRANFLLARARAKRRLKDNDGARLDFNGALVQQPRDAVTAFERGRLLFEMSDYRAALRSLDLAARNGSSENDLHYFRAYSLEKTGQPRQAVATWDRYLKLVPDWNAALRNRGRAKLVLKDVDGALADMDRAVMLEPRNPVPLSVRGGAYFELRRYAEAIRDFDRAEKLGPATPWLLTERGRAKLRLGQWKAAEKDFLAVGRLAPGSIDHLFNRALAREKMGQLEAALADFRAYQAADPNDADTRANIRELQIKLGRYEELGADWLKGLRDAAKTRIESARPGATAKDAGSAPARSQRLAELDTAIQRDPLDIDSRLERARTSDSALFDARSRADLDWIIQLGEPTVRQAQLAEAHNSLGTNLTRKGELEKAAGAFQRAMALDSGWVTPRINAVRNLIARKRYREAVAEADGSLRQWPDSAPLWFHRGRAQYALDDHAGAVESYNRSLALDARQSWAHSNIALVHIVRGEWTQALAANEKALALDSDDLDFKVQRARILIRLHRVAEGFELFETLLREHPLDQNLVIQYANALAFDNQWSRAVDIFDRLIAQQPAKARWYFERARHRVGAGQSGQRLADYDKSIALDPNYGYDLRNRANVHRSFGRFALALADIEGALKLLPEDVFARVVRARTLVGLRRIDEAEAEAASLRALLPASGAALHGAALVKADQRLYAAALTLAEEAVAADPGDYDVWNARCFFRALLGPGDEAIPDCLKALAIRPAYSPTLHSLGFIALKKNDLDEALRQFEAAIAASPAGAHGHFGRSIVLARLGRSEEAAAARRLAIAEQPDIETLYRGYGIDF